jgi:2'-5' RNA ligase
VTATPSTQPPEKTPEKTPEGVRAFLAVNVSVESVRKVADMQMSLRPTAKSRGLRVTWVPAASMHLTLKFFGWVPREAAEAVLGELSARLGDRRPFNLTLAGVGAFPVVERPRVLWVGVQDASGELVKLATDVETWMRGLGFAAEQRPFSAHLTIGRVKEGGSAQDLLAPHKDKQFGPSTISEVVLYESHTLPRGAEYRALGRVILGQPKAALVLPEFADFVPGQPRVAEPETE